MDCCISLLHPDGDGFIFCLPFNCQSPSFTFAILRHRVLLECNIPYAKNCNSVIENVNREEEIPHFWKFYVLTTDLWHTISTFSLTLLRFIFLLWIMNCLGLHIWLWKCMDIYIFIQNIPFSINFFFTPHVKL